MDKKKTEQNQLQVPMQWYTVYLILEWVVITWQGWEGTRIVVPKMLTTQYVRVDSMFVPSQWEMALLCNDVSFWLGASLESVL